MKASGPLVALTPRDWEDRAQYVEIVNLDGPTVTMTHHELSRSSRYFAAQSASAWAASTGWAAILLGDNLPDPAGPLPLNCGNVRSIAGSASGRVALATEAGQILYVDVATRAITAVVPFQSWQVELSSDGTVLGAAGDSAADQWPVRVYSMPAGTRIGSFASSSSQARYHVSVARGGTRIGRSSESEGFTVSDPTFATTYFTVPGGYRAPVLLSPSGRIALSNYDHPYDSFMYEDHTPIGATVGVARGWIDDAKLVVERYDGPEGEPNTTLICDHTGAVITTLAEHIPFTLGMWPDRWFSVVSPTQILAQREARIHSLVDGSVVWSSAYATDWPTVASPWGGMPLPADFAAGRVIRYVGAWTTIETP